jgi:predicted phosphodiesterase
MVRFLLLSDIHLLCLAKEQDKHSRVRDCLIQDLKDYVANNDCINQILVSGDIAFKGEENEYNSALLFFEKICKAAGCAKEDIYVIPGNHDKNFSAKRSELRHIINAGLSYSTKLKNNASNLFYELITKDSDAAKKLYLPFQEYHKFALEMDSFEPLMQQCIDNKHFKYNCIEHSAYYKKSLGNLNDYEIYLYGMNSCLNCDCNDENDFGEGHKMFLPKLTYNIPVNTEGCINISMMHHPLDKIVDGENIAGVLDKKFQIQIFGHMHKPASNVDTSVHIQSGALQPPSEETAASQTYFSVYNIVELDIKSLKKDVLIVKLLVEKFNEMTGKFENLNDECHTFSVSLKKHENRWNKSGSDVNSKTQTLPADISVRQIRLTFLQFPSRESLIRKLGKYDDSKSFNENCIDFLKKMEEKGRLMDLWNKLKY